MLSSCLNGVDKIDKFTWRDLEAVSLLLLIL